MRIGIIIQARMSSSRFPGKVLHPVAGRPMLQYLLERLGRLTGIDRFVVATSDSADDDAVADFCCQQGVDCFRGDLANVARRFLQAVDFYGFDAFVRVNGDSPLLDPALVDRAVRIFRESSADLVTNVLRRTFPRGQSVEVLRTEAYRRGYELMREPEDFEHVTKVFYKSADAFRILDFCSPVPRGAMELAVDTPEHMARFAAVVAAMDRPHWHYSLDEVVGLSERIAAHG